jgi:hypothetical protein
LEFWLVLGEDQQTRLLVADLHEGQDELLVILRVVLLPKDAFATDVDLWLVSGWFGQVIGLDGKATIHLVRHSTRNLVSVLVEVRLRVRYIVVFSVVRHSRFDIFLAFSSDG